MSWLAGCARDWTLDIEQRLDYLLAHTNLTTQVAQLQNSAPEITHLGIPSYQFLNVRPAPLPTPPALRPY